MLPRAWLGLVGALAAGFGAAATFAEVPPESASAILLELNSFRELGSVLYIAAHPDDENTRLIAYLARGRGCRTGYLSLTRGDGGQNLIGPELDEELGAIRTEELLAARRIDGGTQFFSRARDFGFSKDYRDTLRKWDREEVLSDIVRTIRAFRPDILITRFSPVPGGTHGHHTASTILALEAFRLAGDPKAYPEQLGALEPWQPKRILWNCWSPGSRGSPSPNAIPAGAIHLDAGGYQPLLGESFGEVAALSRSMHRSQGNGTLLTRGTSLESFQVLAGEPATKDLLDGIDTTWGRYPGGAELDRLTREVIARFDPLHPAASVPAIAGLRSRLTDLPGDGAIEAKRRQLDRILEDCLGLYAETVIARAEVVPGEALRLRHTVIARTGFPVRWRGVRYPSLGREFRVDLALATNQPVSREAIQTLPAGTPLSQPYWLREQGTAGMFRVDDPALIGRPENPPPLPVEEIFEVAGQTLSVPDEPVQVTVDPAKGEIRRRLEVIPPVALEFGHDLELFAPGAARAVTLQISASRAGVSGSLRVEAPAGWAVAPASQPFRLAAAGDGARFTFTVTPPGHPATATLKAVAEVAGARFGTRRIEIRYDHIPELLLQPPAELKAVCLDLAIRGSRIGYLPGAGDQVSACLERMGYAVTLLADEDLALESLRRFDAVVIGVRAFNTRADLGARLPALLAYVDGGGNVIEQYNTARSLLSTRLAPFDLALSDDRVIDEDSAVTLLVPGHPAFTGPNRISPADFEGWVQERARYLPRQWDSRFAALLSCHDPGESAQAGGLLVARYGRGYFVYTSLSWFRQLPDGVPGAYRLFANLISLGK